MIEIVAIKGARGELIPATPEDAEKLATMPMGTSVKVSITAFHNTRFHRKLMALYRLGFEVFQEMPTEPQIHRGREVAKSFDGFRRDTTILAGHYNAYYRLNGEVRFEAKSLSYRRMNDQTKLQVYRDVLNQVWGRVLRQGAQYKSPEQVDEVVERLIGME
ncbi:DUF1367 family protein [Uliginosibacterium sediminicola]|uniref:DUF1367 family protein n=1 Tax=Uliginosibacterium sediminicola TaxID=2024550 RepID=A0ABU9YWN5_9RHOO